VRAILRVILSLLLEVQCIHARRHAHRLALRAPLGASGRFALVRYASVQGKLPHLKGGGSASVGFGRLRSASVGFGRLRSASVGFGRLRSASVGFGRLRSA